MTEPPINLPPHGFVALDDVFGSDADVARAARTSYAKGTRSTRDDERLIRFLIEHGHTSPFEMAEIRWLIQAPMFVARQLVRHRTANWNEVSLRYSEAEVDRFWAPEPEQVRGQGTGRNKQVGDGVLSEATRREAEYWFRAANEDAAATYQRLIALGVAREQARAVLPVSIYTRWVFKLDLNNLMRLFSKRLAPDAQAETREVVALMYRDFADRFPLTAAAYAATGAPTA